MEIDWLTVIAQIVNFLVLVWLLKHFLYKPVLDAMEKRQQSIADNIHEAEQRDQKAQLTIQEYQDKIVTLEQDKTKLLDGAITAAQEQRQKLEKQARLDVQKQKESWQKQLQQEQKNYFDDLGKMTMKSIQDTGRRVLGDLSDRSLEEQIIQVFLTRLKNLDDGLLTNLQSTNGDVEIISAFELKPEIQQKLTLTIYETINDSAKVTFTVSSDLICGISLVSGGYQVGWNINEYLQNLDQQLLENLKYKVNTHG